MVAIEWVMILAIESSLGCRMTWLLSNPRAASPARQMRQRVVCRGRDLSQYECAVPVPCALAVDKGYVVAVDTYRVRLAALGVCQSLSRASRTEAPREGRGDHLGGCASIVANFASEFSNGDVDFAGASIVLCTVVVLSPASLHSSN